MQLVQHLRDLLAGSPPPVPSSIDVLERLARDRFAELRTNPPIIYNNDPTWPPSEAGIYWAEDLGYALWLRTYAEVARRAPGTLSLPALPRGTS